MTANTNVSVRLTPTLRLKQALEKAGIKDPASITGLTITGTLTEDDFYQRKNEQDTSEIGFWQR